MRVLTVEDHSLVRDGIALVLDLLEPGVEVLAAESCAAALALIADAPDLDLVLLDIGLPDEDGLVCLEKLRAYAELVPFVMVSADAGPATIRQALDAGARGFVPKQSGKDVLLGALRLVLAGGVYIPAEALASAPADDGSGLTPRQREVLQLLGEGCSNKAIATRLGMAEATVRQHVTAIFRALRVSNRTEAALKARDY